MVKGRVEINTEKCKSCLYCVRTCPRNVLGQGEAVNRQGYQYVEAQYPENCIGCGMCARICPDAVITVYQEV